MNGVNGKKWRAQGINASRSIDPNVFQAIGQGEKKTTEKKETQ